MASLSNGKKTKPGAHPVHYPYPNRINYKKPFIFQCFYAGQPMKDIYQERLQFLNDINMAQPAEQKSQQVEENEQTAQDKNNFVIGDLAVLIQENRVNGAYGKRMKDAELKNKC